MPISTPAILLISLLAFSARAQESLLAPPPDTSAAAGEAPVAAQDLLPEVMGPMERVLWGRAGLMRHLGMPLDEETREKEVFLRRGLLTAHQVGGFFTLAAMSATAFTGQQILNGRDNLGDRKRLLVNTTIYSYFLTAALAMAAPPPMMRRPQWSSISWHKALAAVHLTGMLITPILGGQIEDDYDRRHLHQISGYVTLAAFTGAMLVVTF